MKKSTSYTAKTPDADGKIHYTDEEHAVWHDLFTQQAPKTRTHCAPDYLAGLDAIDLPADRIPQCVDLSRRLKTLTGWSVEPVPALIGFKTFFSMLANKTFPAASFIRSRKDFDYIEEPDIFHEIFGHTPLLTDPRFAKFSETIGKAGQAANPSEYSWLIRLYWFTIEFGLIQTDNGTKALGSGLASSPTELLHAVSSAPQKRPFDVIDILRTPYRIDIHQPVYFVLDTADQLFDAAHRNLRADVKHAQSLGLHAPLFDPKAA